jgi:hypothetical protein
MTIEEKTKERKSFWAKREMTPEMKKMTRSALYMAGTFIGATAILFYIGASAIDGYSKQMELKYEDINRNGKRECFLEVNGEKYFLSIDGKNIEDTLTSGYGFRGERK